MAHRPTMASCCWARSAIMMGLRRTERDCRTNQVWSCGVGRALLHTADGVARLQVQLVWCDRAYTAVQVRMIPRFFPRSSRFVSYTVVLRSQPLGSFSAIFGARPAPQCFAHRNVSS